MAPVDKPPVHYFVHVPKTAGVTVRTWLRDAYARDEVIFVYDGKLAEDPEALSFAPHELLRRADELPASLRLFFGHFAFDPERLIPGRVCRGISLLRDPVARIVSWRRFVKRHGARQSNPLLVQLSERFQAGRTLPEVWSELEDDLAMRGVPELDNGIVRMFANATGPAGTVGEADLQRAQSCVETYFDFVGHIDWFEASMRRIAAILGRPYHAVASCNESAGGRSEERLQVGHRDADEIDWLLQRTELDRRFVAWLTERFPPSD